MIQVWLLSSMLSILACEDAEEASPSTVSEAISVETEGIEKEVHHDGLMVRTKVTPTSVRLGDPFIWNSR